MIANCTVFGESDNIGEPALSNPAEAAAGRHLPQTYMRFVRPDQFSEQHESMWDTLNAIESYDGHNVITNTRIAWFRNEISLPDPEGILGPAVRLTGGVTQVEYNSRFAEDPRNYFSGLSFVDVVNPIKYRNTESGFGYSMIQNTVTQDPNNTFGYGPGVSITYEDPFFVANRTPGSQYTLDSPRNILIVPNAAVDFAQIEVGAAGLAPGTDEMTVEIRDSSGMSYSLSLDAMSIDVPGTLDWAFNASLGLYEGDPATQQTGIYFIEFENGAVPAGYEIKVQFCERVDVPTVISLPLSSLASAPLLNDVTPMSQIGDVNQDLVVDARDLLVAFPVGPKHAYHHDAVNSRLFLKTSTLVLVSGGSAEVEGTRNRITVN